MKPGHALMVVLALVVLSSSALDSHAGETVSPGALDRFGMVEMRCPTFSWGFVPGALAYELVAYRMPEGEARELGSEDEALFASITGSATSWTPSAEQCFDAGEGYVWFVRSVTELADDAGQLPVTPVVVAAIAPREIRHVVLRLEFLIGAGTAIVPG